MEEYGFEIAVLELLDIVDHIIPAEKQHWISPTFICTVKSGTPVIREPHKCEAIGWFDLDRIPDDQLTIASKKVWRCYGRNSTDEQWCVRGQARCLL